MKFLRLTLPCVIVAGLSLIYAQTGSLPGDLQALLANPLGSANVILLYKSAPTLLDLSQIALLGGTVNAQYSILPAVAAKLPLANIVTLLLSDLNLAYVSLDRPLGATLDYSSAAVNAAVAAQYGLIWSGIRIALIDTWVTPPTQPNN